MRKQVVLLSIFAMLWGLAALAVDDVRGAMLALPVAVTALLIVAGWKILPPAGLSREEAGRIRRLVRLWSFIELVAMAAAVFVLQRRHAPEFLPAVIAVIVGLHFLPLARGIPQRLFYVTGAALVATGVIVPLLVLGHLQMVVALAAGAVILWLSAVGIILTPRKVVLP